MKGDLEYFNVFLNNPASLSNAEFNRLLHEWVEFIKANPKKYGMKGRGWKRAWRRIYDDVLRRDDIRDEFDELDALMEASEEMNDADKIKLNRRWMDFMKKYRLEYEFTDEQVAGAEAQFIKYEKAVRKARQAEINLQIAKGEAEASVDAFADSMFEAQDKYGKPFSFPAYKIPKRGRDN